MQNKEKQYIMVAKDFDPTQLVSANNKKGFAYYVRGVFVDAETGMPEPTHVALYTIYNAMKRKHSSKLVKNLYLSKPENIPAGYGVEEILIDTQGDSLWWVYPLK